MGRYQAVVARSWFSKALGIVQDMCGNLFADWNWRATLSSPSASSPRPWMKMKAADLETSLGGVVGGSTIGGFLSGAMLGCMGDVQRPR